jgi:isopentenyl-diphosphate delta-isomerase
VTKEATMQQTTETVEDEVVLLDESGTPIGRAPKSAAHGPDTALHLAFSCHVVNPIGEVLVTRRALGKQAWPGVWTNSFCGHQRWTEAPEDSLQRHVVHELGAEVTDVQVALPDFRYRAVDASGVVENEICPVFVARVVGDLDPNPDEVAEHAWSDPVAFRTAVEATPWAFSPWMVEQVEALAAVPTAERTPGAVALAAALGLR